MQRRIVTMLPAPQGEQDFPTSVKTHTLLDVSEQARLGWLPAERSHPAVLHSKGVGPAPREARTGALLSEVQVALTSSRPH